MPSQTISFSKLSSESSPTLSPGPTPLAARKLATRLAVSWSPAKSMHRPVSRSTMAVLPG